LVDRRHRAISSDLKLARGQYVIILYSYIGAFYILYYIIIIYIYSDRALSFGRAAYYRFTLHYVLLLLLWCVYIYYAPSTRDNDSGVLRGQRSRENTSETILFTARPCPFYVISA